MGVSFDDRGQRKPLRTGNKEQMIAHGRFVLDPEGRVLASTFGADATKVKFLVDIRYRDEPTLKMLVPVEMHERYSRTDAKSDYTDVSSLYSACQQANVIVDEELKGQK